MEINKRKKKRMILQCLNTQVAVPSQQEVYIPFFDADRKMDNLTNTYLKQPPFCLLAFLLER